MEESTTSPGKLKIQPASPGKYILFAVFILLLLAGGFLAYRAWSSRSTKTAQPAIEVLSAEELADRYGLTVRLIGVTAGGGMIDFRLKILDSLKAQRFLEDPANLPRLVVAEGGEALIASEGLDDDIEWQDGGVLFNLYSNDNGLIKPGTAVIVRFGDIQLEPIVAQ